MHDNAHSGLASHSNGYKDRIPGVTFLPIVIEYEFDENGFCTKVKEMPIEKAFEKFFDIPYDKEAFSIYK